MLSPLLGRILEQLIFLRAFKNGYNNVTVRVKYDYM